MQKNKKRFVVLAVAVCVAVCGAILYKCILHNGKLTNDYAAANKRTNALESYEMDIYTVIGVQGEEKRQTAINRNVKAANIGTNNLIYEVATSITATDVESAQVLTDESRYVYWDGNYYYTVPNVKYYMATDKEKAATNLENMESMINVPDETIENGTVEKKDGEVCYYYAIGYDEASDYVKGVQMQAIDLVGRGTFKTKDVNGSVTVKNGYVAERTLYMECENEYGDVAEIEFLIQLREKSAAPEKPNADEYSYVE